MVSAMFNFGGVLQAPGKAAFLRFDELVKTIFSRKDAKNAKKNSLILIS